MIRKCLVTTALFLVLLGFYPCSLQAQATGKALGLVYSNNLNGETDSCPT